MLYRTGHAAKGRTRSERVRKFFELTFKSLVMVVLPLGSAVVFGMVWYYVAYLQGLHFSPDVWRNLWPASNCGLWFIKDIPNEWLSIDVDEYRAKYFPKI